MIICIDCNGKGYDSHVVQRPANYPVGECNLCHKNAPLTEGYRKVEPGKYFDCMGNEMVIGDTIAYSVAAGRSSGKMVIGKIYKFGARTVNVEFETIEHTSDYDSREVTTVKTFFNYSPSKCLKLNTQNM